MRHVVERCPSCGVEHDEAVGGLCEACGTPLRAWCRRHGRAVGWLQGPTCPHCPQEPAPTLRTPPSRAPAPAAPVRALVAPPAPAHVVPRETGAAEAEESWQPTNWQGHLGFALMILLLVPVLGALAGVAAGVVFLAFGSGGFPDTLLECGFGGAIAGGILGVVAFVLYGIDVLTTDRK